MRFPQKPDLIPGVSPKILEFVTVPALAGTYFGIISSFGLVEVFPRSQFVKGYWNTREGMMVIDLCCHADAPNRHG
jgi:hypothetical protein